MATSFDELPTLDESGICEQCKGWARRLVTPYWLRHLPAAELEDRRLCPGCCVAVAEDFTRCDAWPVAGSLAPSPEELATYRPWPDLSDYLDEELAA